MSLLDAIRLALTNLSHAKLRSALTMLGVSIGIASLSGMVSLGVGLEDSIMNRFAQSGVFDSITVMQGSGRFGGLAARGRFGGGGRGGRAAQSADQPAADTHEPLDDKALEKFTALPDVKAAYPNINLFLQVAFKGRQEQRLATGVPMTSKGEGPFETLWHGAFFKNEQDMACMVTLDLAKDLTDQDPKTLVGQTITVSYATNSPMKSAAPAASAAASPTPSPEPAAGSPLNQLAAMAGMQVNRHDEPCAVIGIVERETGPGIGPNVSPLMLPLAKARAIEAVQVTSVESLLRQPGNSRGYSTVTVKVSSVKKVEDVEAKIKAMGFSAFSLNDAVRGAKRAFLVIDILLSLIGSIALTVSSLGIVNTMVMSILERTREIGIMKAIGGGDSDIRRIFLIEASVIGLLGGIAGVVIGWVVGRAVNFGANIYITSQGGTRGDLFSMPFWLIGGAVGFSLLVSLLAGSYPARRAARLDPIQALRHD